MEEELELMLVGRDRVLSTMASLSLAAGETLAGEGYLLELMAYLAFADHTGKVWVMS